MFAQLEHANGPHGTHGSQQQSGQEDINVVHPNDGCYHNHHSVVHRVKDTIITSAVSAPEQNDTRRWIHAKISTKKKLYHTSRQAIHFLQKHKIQKNQQLQK